MNIMNAIVNENINDDANNSMDKLAGILGYIPAFILRLVIGGLRWLDNIGLMPKGVADASPFHCSAFLTNVGSVGIGPIYHHLYEFGTCSIFVAMGNKYKYGAISREGARVEKRFVGLKFVTDERICDGKYYADSMKVLRRLLNNPELLMTPPAEIPIDDGVPARKLKIKK